MRAAANPGFAAAAITADLPTRRLFPIAKLSSRLSCIGVILIACLVAPTVAAEIKSIKISSTLDPNAIIITEVDVVFIYDQEIAESLAATKSAWYSGKFMFTRRVGEKVDIVNTFVPQGFDSVTLNLPDRHASALRAVVFAHHDDGESPAIDILEMEEVLIEIDPFGIRVTGS